MEINAQIKIIPLNIYSSKSEPFYCTSFLHFSLNLKVHGQHLLNNPDCTDKYEDDSFTILHRAQSAHYLKILETVYTDTSTGCM